MPGTWKHEDAAKMVSEAFKAGYRHIDTARVYDTEKATGMAFRASGLARKDVFITTKLK
jgi:diketogulonate reductase-like aldo/keto reductase